MPVSNTNVPVTLFDGGIKQDKSSIAIPPSNMPNCRNIVIKDGVPQSRTGLVSYNPTADGQSDPWQTTIPDKQRLGFYHYEDFEHNQKRFWHFGIFDATPDEVTAHFLATDNNQWSKIACAGTVTGTQDYWYNVCQVINDANNDGAPDANGEFLILNVTTTDSTVDKGSNIQQYNADAGVNAFTDLSLNAGDSVKYKCKRVVFFANRLVLLGISSTEIIWSEEWDHDDILSDEAFNFFYAYDTGGPILNGEILKNELIVFKKDSIYSGYKITTTPFIRFDRVYPDVGLMSSRLMVSLGQIIYFVGNNNIYAYAGGSELVPIGKPIWTQFLSEIRKGGVSATQLYRDRCFASVHRDTGEIIFWIVTGNAEWPNVGWVFNTFQRTWTRWVLPDDADTSPTTTLSVTGWGEYEHDTTISTAEYLPFYTIAQSQLSGGNTVDNLRTAQFDYSTRTDADPADAEIAAATTRPIDSWLETKDFVRTLEDKTDWHKFMAEGRGFGSSPVVAIGISIDGGVNYSTEKTGIALQTTKDEVFFEKFNVSGTKVRWRIRSNASGTGFTCRVFEIIPGTPESTEN